MGDTKLMDLAARCEQATGPDRELDEAIDRGAFPGGWANEFFDPSRHDLPSYTASLDAAMTLVPSGYYWSLDNRACALVSKALGEGVPSFSPATLDGDSAKTPALALCAAALRAAINPEAGG